MGLITKTAICKWHPSNKERYTDKRYIFTKMGDEFEVKVEDLIDNSSAKVDIRCDGCNEFLRPMIWLIYKKFVKENGKYYCVKCANNGYKKWISFYEWCYKNLSKEEADKILARWDYKLNIDKNGKVLTPQDITYGSEGSNRKGYWFKCLDHPEHKSEQKSIANFTKGILGCIVCNQCNSIAVTHLNLVKYFLNKEDASKYSFGSNNKIIMRCPDCGYEKKIIINDLSHQGFGCPRCGDGNSYPEKFMFCVFEQLLESDFNIQLSKTNFKWCDNYRYDFYINKINCIIETNGIQHYEEIVGNWDDLNTVKNNDKDKEILAKQNGIVNYIVLDCRKSELEWIKNSIISSELPSLLNFKEKDIDWLKCHEYACSNRVKEACELWVGGFKKVADIAYKMKLERSTIVKYLKQGFELNWCDYNPIEQKLINFISVGKRRCRQVICLTTGEIFDSLLEASSKYNIVYTGISASCRNKSEYAGKHQETREKMVWMYYDEYLKTQEII